VIKTLCKHLYPLLLK